MARSSSRSAAYARAASLGITSSNAGSIASAYSSAGGGAAGTAAAQAAYSAATGNSAPTNAPLNFSTQGNGARPFTGGDPGYYGNTSSGAYNSLPGQGGVRHGYTNYGPNPGTQPGDNTYIYDEATGTPHVPYFNNQEETPQDQPLAGESPGPVPSDMSAMGQEAEAGGGAGTDVSGMESSSGTVGGTHASAGGKTGGSWNDLAGGAKAFNQGQMQNIATLQQQMQSQGIGQAEMMANLAGRFAGGSNELFMQRYAAGKGQQVATQSDINSIHPNMAPITRESDDSPYRNRFGEPAVAQEKLHPGYMNDRNSIIASSVATGTAGIEYMTAADRAAAITNEIVRRQGYNIDPDIKSWYDETVDKINSIISQTIPELKSGDYFTMLLNGQDTSDVRQDNPQYQAGKRRYDKLNMYVSGGETMITGAVRDGTLLPGSDTWNDLVTKGFGAVLTQAQGTLSAETDVMSSIMTAVFGFDPNQSLASQATIPNTIEGAEAMISMEIIKTMNPDNIPSFAQRLLDDDDVQNRRMKGADTVAEINTLNQQVADLSDSMKEMFVAGGGTDENAPFMTAYITEKAKPMIRKLDMLQTQYSNEAAMLQIASENARTEYDSLVYQRQAKLDTYNFLLGMLDRQEARQQNAQALAFQNKQYEENKAFQREQRERQKAGSPITKPVGSGNIVSWDIDQSVDPDMLANAAFAGANAMGGAGSSFAGAAAALANNIKNIQLDENAMQPFLGALNAMNDMGLKVTVGDTLRTEERQKQLVAEGKSWTMNSKHLQGLAVDIYDTGMKKPSNEQVQIMNSFGRYQPAATLAKGDYGHFEYIGGVQASTNTLIQGVANGSIAGNSIYSTKNLEAAGLTAATQPQIASFVGGSLINNYLTPNSSVAEITKLVDKAIDPKNVGADPSEMVATLNNVVGPEKTLEYLDNKTSSAKEADVDTLVSMWSTLIESNAIDKKDMKKIFKDMGVWDSYGQSLYDVLY